MIFDSKIRAHLHFSKKYKIIHLAYVYVDKLTITSLQLKPDTKFKLYFLPIIVAIKLLSLYLRMLFKLLIEYTDEIHKLTPKKEKEIISLLIKEKKFLKILSDPLNGKKFYQ